MEDDNMKFYEKNVANKKYNRNLSDLKYCPHILMHFVNEIICKKDSILHSYFEEMQFDLNISMEFGTNFSNI